MTAALKTSSATGQRTRLLPCHAGRPPNCRQGCLAVAGGCSHWPRRLPCWPAPAVVPGVSLGQDGRRDRLSAGSNDRQYRRTGRPSRRTEAVDLWRRAVLSFLGPGGSRRPVRSDRPRRCRCAGQPAVSRVAAGSGAGPKRRCSNGGNRRRGERARFCALRGVVRPTPRRHVAMAGWRRLSDPRRRRGFTCRQVGAGPSRAAVGTGRDRDPHLGLGGQLRGRAKPPRVVSASRSSTTPTRPSWS